MTSSVRVLVVTTLAVQFAFGCGSGERSAGSLSPPSSAAASGGGGISGSGGKGAEAATGGAGTTGGASSGGGGGTKPATAGSSGSTPAGAGGASAGAPTGNGGRGGSGAGTSAGTAGVAGQGGSTAPSGGSSAAGASSIAGSSNTGGAGAAGTGPVVGTPHNPVLPGLNADPQIALFGDKFFIYPTTDGFTDWRSTSFHAFSSTDLVSFRDEGVVLDLGPDVSWADDRAWAPGIVSKAGTYYFYFSANLQIGVATSKSPTGPFKDALGHPLVSTAEYGGQSIDPFAFLDDDGRAYLYFGSTSAGGHVVELGDDMVSFKGTPAVVTISGFKEGSVAFKRNGTYYFMYSEGDTRSADYDVAYGTGTSPLGPFTKAKVNPILKRDDAQGILGTGHNSVLALPNGDYYIAYHRFAIPGGDGTHREVCIDKLEFNADGTIVPVKPTR